MVYLHAALCQDLFQIPVRYHVAHVEEDREEDDILGEMSALECDHHMSSEGHQPLRPSILLHTSVKNQSLRQNPPGLCPFTQFASLAA
jgi:hypothetical protein